MAGRKGKGCQQRTHRKFDPLEILLEVGIQRAVAISQRDTTVVRAQHGGITERQLACQRILRDRELHFGRPDLCCVHRLHVGMALRLRGTRRLLLA